MRIAATIGTFLLATVALSWLLGEASVRYELWSTSALSRSELPDDFGLGILGMLAVQPLSVIGGAFTAVLVWRSLTARTRAARPNGQGQASRRGPHC